MEVWVLLARHGDHDDIDCYGVYPTLDLAQAGGLRIWSLWTRAIECAWTKISDCEWEMVAAGPHAMESFDVVMLVRAHNLAIAQEGD